MAGAIDTVIGARLSPTLIALEQLRSLLEGNNEVSIPGVVVAGAQSAGKSSVLEALAGMKLPRGQNITTRVPLILSLQCIPGAPTHAIISHDAAMKDATTFDASDLGAAIEAFTAQLAGVGTGVRETPIYLRVIRGSGPTLTLIDLPGITYNSSDESQDIHSETVRLVNKYIENDNMVILVVIPAMDDFANAEAVALAKKYDPEGRRTLGVVTKVDNVQAGCGIRAKLRMDPGHVQLHLGFIAVVNRTPAEVENDTPAEEVRARERRFFKENPEVAGLEKEFWGLDTLVERIVGIQAERVQAFIPEFTKLAKRRIKDLDSELRRMPETFTDNNQRSEAFRTVVLQVRDQLRDLLTIGNDEKISSEQVLNVVPQVTAIYRAYSADVLQEMVPDFFSDDYHQKVCGALRRVDGMALSNLLSGRAFNILFGEVFSENLEPRSLEMVATVKTHMERVLNTLFDNACEHYPGLLSELKGSLVEEFMEHNEQHTLKAVSNVVRAELGWVFTQDRGYARVIEDVREKVDRVRANEISSKAVRAAGTRVDFGHQAEAVGDVPSEFIQKMVDSSDGKDEATRELQVTIHSYTDVVCRRLSDVVPKQTHHFLVDSLCDGLVPWMTKKVSAADLEDWLTEDVKTKRRRKDTSRKLAQFRQGMELLQGARSTL